MACCIVNFQLEIVYCRGKDSIDDDVLSRIRSSDGAEEAVVFPNVVTALFDYHLVKVCPVIECLSSQEAVLTLRDEVDSGTPLSSVDWKAEQSANSAIVRVVQIVETG